MSDLLLQTKLFKPALRPSLINRTHLIERLNNGLGQGTPTFAARLTLISAPAGFGKTTLVSAWLAGLTAVRIAWLSLDENDNDPVRFLAYLIAALQTAVPDIGETAVRLLQSPQPPAPETILTLLINDLSQNGRSLILILDDYHTITTPVIHQALAFFLDHLPPTLHLLLTTRSDPPLPLSRLRARSQITELRANDLRLTLDEAGRFLKEVMGLSLSNEALEALEQRTEGWLAGLQLAAIAMQSSVSPQGRDDLPNFIAAFTGSHRFILDYLTDEVLEQRPKGTRQFLLQTAILDRFCAPLCDAVTGRNDSQAILERLEQANLFLIPLDQERRWYRYHHLFADVLRNRLQQSASPSDDPVDLHRRASIWFEQAGLLDEAIHHALTAPDVERAASLVEQNSLRLLQLSETLSLHRWLAQLPVKLVQSRPRLILANGWDLILTGQSQAAKVWLAAPQTEMVLNGADISAEIRGELALLRATIARVQFEGDHGLALAQDALALLPEHQRGLRAGAIHLMGVARFRQGDTAAASQSFIEAVAVGEVEEGPYMALDTLQDLASIQIRQGRLGQIKQTCQKAMQLAARGGGRLLPAAGMAYIDYGGVLYEENRLEEAVQALSYGTDLLRGATEHYLLMEGYTLLARVRQIYGDYGAALAAVKQGESWLRLMQVTDYHPWGFLALGQARLWIGRGDLVSAVQWAKECNWWPEDTHLGYHQAVTLIRLRLAQGRNSERDGLFGDAADIIERMLAAAQAKAWWGHVIELSFLAALRYQLVGDTAAMLNSLERALALAEPEGFVRLFVDEGEATADLLRHARRQGLYRDYVDRLLAAFPAGETKQLGGDSLPEPLSEREMEVLQLMASGASNKEIAGQLFIAVTTVKKHVGNILVKLDTPNRVQAISRARTLGLLS